MSTTLRVVVTLMVSVMASTAFAQNDRAETLFRLAVDELRAGEYASAARHFEESLAVQPQAKTACNLGLTYDRWTGHAPQARDAYVRCAELDDSGRFRDHALERAAALRREIAEAQANEEANTVDPDPDPDLDPDPDADADVDEGATVSEVPIEESTAPVLMAPPQTRPVTLPRTRSMLWAGLPLAIIGGGLLAGGAGVAIGSQSDSDTLRENYPDGRIPPSDTVAVELAEDLNRKAKLSRVLYGVGGAALAAGATLIVVDLIVGAADSDDRVSVRVGPTRDGAMAQARMRF